MPTQKYVAGLDTIRFLAALWVVWGHFGAFPLLAGIDRSNWIGWLIAGIYNNFFSGPAAVIVFFVISGFCIHFPFAAGGTFRLVPYWFRRYARIAIPMGAAILLASGVGLKLGLFEKTILWSLFAELVYYTLYPGIRFMLGKISWRVVLSVACAFSAAVILSDPGAGDYPSYGWKMNWLLALPCWLLGVRLADWYSTHSEKLACPTTPTMWKWRFLIFALAATCSALRFHSPIGYPWSLNFFAIGVYFWLKRELSWRKSVPPSAVLEWFGTWSYSLYLVHGIANVAYFFLRYSETYRLPNLGYSLNWAIQMATILSICYVFYLAVERPAHSFARFGASLISNRKPTTPLRPPESRKIR